ncbi:DUF6529 family protein [Pseudonocardia nantongensis]|uniref:DUF6529 family protein n=1 Tax=Pseudonocardia nantongensis TaxID=1181885 RepID=UPI003977F5CE
MPNPVDGTGPSGTRHHEPRHDPRLEDPRYDDPRYDDPPDDGPGSGGSIAGVPGERAGWAETPGAPDDDPAPAAPSAHRVRRPYGGRAAVSRPGHRSAPPEPGPGDGATATGPPIRLIAVPAAVGALVAVALGVWARQHEGTGVAVNLAGFSSGGAAKAWLGSLALLLAVVQGVTGRMLHRGDPLLGTVHRWTGRAAVLVTVPVAVQCLYAFGWSGATTSALLHSLLGCVFYGAFVTKMLLLRRPGVPGWMLATCGGLLLAVLAGVWLTSALWFFTGHGLSF